MHNGKGRAGQIFNFSLVLMILISVAILPIKYLPTYPLFENVLTAIEFSVITIFTIEYVLRIYAAPKRLEYVFSFFGFVDFLSIMPFYAGIFQADWIRFLRLVRFLKIGEMQAGAAADNDEMTAKTLGLVPGETVEYIVTKHPLFLFIHCIAPVFAITFSLSIFLLANGNVYGIALGTCIIIFALMFLLKTWLDFSYDVIYLTNLRLIFHNQHLFGRNTNQMNYSAITNVKPSYTNILSVLFRYGSLDIETAADTTGRVSIKMVRSHEKAAHLIMQKSFGQQHEQTQRTVEADGKNNNGSTATPAL
jgi:hypothetical protein